MCITVKLTLKRTLILMALAAAAGLILYGGWDQIAGRVAESWPKEWWGRFWGLAAHWLGLGGIQVAAIALAIIFAHVFKRRRMRLFCLKSLAAFILSGLAVQMVKILAGRPRPRLGAVPWDAFALSLNGGMNSFPSGHATTSFVLAAMLAARFPHASWLFYGLAVFIAMGRVVGGSHYPSDVLAGACLGLAVGWCLSSWLTPKLSSPGRWPAVKSEPWPNRNTARR